MRKRFLKIAVSPNNKLNKITYYTMSTWCWRCYCKLGKCCFLVGAPYGEVMCWQRRVQPHHRQPTTAELQLTSFKLAATRFFARG